MCVHFCNGTLRPRGLQLLKWYHLNITDIWILGPSRVHPAVSFAPCDSNNLRSSPNNLPIFHGLCEQRADVLRKKWEEGLNRWWPSGNGSGVLWMRNLPSFLMEYLGCLPFISGPEAQRGRADEMGTGGGLSLNNGWISPLDVAESAFPTEHSCCSTSQPYEQEYFK